MTGRPGGATTGICNSTAAVRQPDRSSWTPCWKAGRDAIAGFRAAMGAPAAIAVGTDGQNSIHVLKLAAAGPCPILRQFRGHADYVTSVGVSSDGRLPCVRFGGWDRLSLEPGVVRAARDRCRTLGAELSVKNNQLVATEVLPSGPLFAKGFAKGMF